MKTFCNPLRMPEWSRNGYNVRKVVGTIVFVLFRKRKVMRKGAISVSIAKNILNYCSLAV